MKSKFNKGDKVTCIDDINAYYNLDFIIEEIVSDVDADFYPYRCVSNELLPHENPVFFCASSIAHTQTHSK